MAQVDFFTGLLPFVITYILFYLVLKEEVPVIQKNENAAAVIAFSIAFLVARFITVNPYYQEFILGFFGRLTVGLIGFFGLLVLLAFTGFELNTDSGRPLLAFIVIIITLGAFSVSGGFSEVVAMLLGDKWAGSMTELLDYTFDSGLIWILLVGIALLWVSSGDNGQDTDKRDLIDWLLGTGNGDPPGG
ncbi:MAG: hypothetical protein ABEJ02_02145 [Candidatus Paceibacteria bacterium]